MSCGFRQTLLRIDTLVVRAALKEESLQACTATCVSRRDSFDTQRKTLGNGLHELLHGSPIKKKLRAQSHDVSLILLRASTSRVMMIKDAFPVLSQRSNSSSPPPAPGKHRRWGRPIRGKSVYLDQFIEARRRSCFKTVRKYFIQLHDEETALIVPGVVRMNSER
jgi:hypothetical protein